MKLTSSVFRFGIALLYLGCSKSDFGFTPSYKVQDADQIVFNISFSTEQNAIGKAIIQSKVVTDIDFNSTWEVGDAIGIYAVKRHKDNPSANLLAKDNYIHNKKLSLQADGSWVGEQLFYAAEEEVLDFYAYYPYDVNQSDPTNMSFTVQTDQKGEAYNQSDLLIANKVVNISSKTPVNLQFKHLLSLLQVEVPTSNMIGSGPNKTLSLSIPNLRNTISLNMNGEEQTLANTRVTIQLHRVETNLNTATTYTYRALIPYQVINKGTNIMYSQDERNYVYSIPKPTTLEIGKVKRFEIKMPLVIHSSSISAGDFVMGSHPDERENLLWEELHPVKLTRDYRISSYPITNAQFAVFLNENKVGENGVFKRQLIIASPTEISSRWGLEWKVNTWKPIVGYENHPVIYVSWAGAYEFAKWIGGALPTEAQWEYAARAGTSTAFSFGTNYQALDKYGWYLDNSGEKTHQVGEKLPNQWGLYDMYGNVYEWVNDWYDATYYSSSPIEDPQGPKEGEERVSRGGAMNRTAADCRSGHRNKFLPGLVLNNLGFRVVFQ